MLIQTQVIDAYERDACVRWLYKKITNQKRDSKCFQKYNGKTAARKRKERIEQWEKNEGCDREPLMTAAEEAAAVLRLASLINCQLDQLPPGTKEAPQLLYIGVTAQCVVTKQAWC